MSEREQATEPIHLLKRDYNSVELTISAVGEEAGADLDILRDWLESAGDQVPWQLGPDHGGPSGGLGIGVTEICAVIGAAGQIPFLVDRIRSWFPTRHQPPRIQITITLDPGSPERPSDGPQA